MDGLAAVGAASDIGSRNIDGNGFEQINIGVLKLRDDLRWRCFADFS